MSDFGSGGFDDPAWDLPTPDVDVNGEQICGHCGSVLDEYGNCPAWQPPKCAFCGCDLNDDEKRLGFCTCCGPA